MRKEKSVAIDLRRSGKTYGEIQRILGTHVSKSTLSSWVGKIALLKPERVTLEKRRQMIVRRAQRFAVLANKKKREEQFRLMAINTKQICYRLRDKQVSKIALASLYLGEGGKTQRGSLMFGNSNASIIKIFLDLLRYAYSLDESKFRCTVQCRADQNIDLLERFWAGITKIPRSRFYGAQIDPRTVGKKSKKSDYRGVCRIDYFSANIYNELKLIGQHMVGVISGR